MSDTLPAYREPWQHGAYAYPQADTIDAMWEGVRRKRKPLTVHVSHEAIGSHPCAACGEPLAGPYPVNPGDPPDEWRTDTIGYAYVDVKPRERVAVPMHYYCAWGVTMRAVLDVSRVLRGH